MGVDSLPSDVADDVVDISNKDHEATPHHAVERSSTSPSAAWLQEKRKLFEGMKKLNNLQGLKNEHLNKLKHVPERIRRLKKKLKKTKNTQLKKQIKKVLKKLISLGHPHIGTQTKTLTAGADGSDPDDPDADPGPDPQGDPGSYLSPCSDDDDCDTGESCKNPFGLFDSDWASGGDYCFKTTAGNSCCSGCSDACDFCTAGIENCGDAGSGNGDICYPNVFVWAWSLSSAEAGTTC